MRLQPRAASRSECESPGEDARRNCLRRSDETCARVQSLKAHSSLAGCAWRYIDRADWAHLTECSRCFSADSSVCQPSQCRPFAPLAKTVEISPGGTPGREGQALST